MSDQNRDDFYEGPPIEEPEHWHDAPVFDESAPAAGGPANGSAANPTPMADPSLSRAVDREGAGVPATEIGYDRAGEGPAAGPLEPADQAG